MWSRRLPLTLIAALWGAMAVRVGTVWPQLPTRMASHFNGAGRADGWMSRDGFVLFWLGINGALTLLLVTIATWVPWALINVPNKDYWADPARQPLARHRMAVWSAWFAVGLNALMASVLELILRANLMPKPTLSSNHAALLVGFLIFTGLMMVVLLRQFRVPAASKG
jgi:serine/threonine-protein kinase